MTSLVLSKPLQPLVWSVRREMWEHRLVLAAPVVIGVLVVAGYLAAMPFGVYRGLADHARQHATIDWAYNVGCFLCLVTSLASALFYCLEALHGERRDRSILFWKSLPVSDFETVLAKLAVPTAVLPAFAFAIIVAVWTAIFVASTLIVAVSGLPVGPLWSSAMFPALPTCLLYALAVTALWYAPIYCGLLCVSVWAKRAPFLWAGLPLILVAAVDRLVIHSGRVEAFFQYRLFGWFEESMRLNAAGLPIGRTPERFFATPGLWLGLAVAVALFLLTVRLRRRSSPI